MKRGSILFLSAVFLLGIGAPYGQAFAHESEKPFHPRPLSSEERRPPREEFRRERAQDPEKFRQRREEMRARAEDRARKADANRDGVISREEAGQSMPHLSRHFEEVDTNRDGQATREEVRAFREKRMQQRLDRGRGDPRF